MNREEALAVLGVNGQPDGAALRRAYRRLLRRHHPDVAGADTQAATVRIIQAYRVLRGQADAEPAPAPPPSPPPPGGRAEGDAVCLALPPHEAFLLLLDVAQRYGEVTYLDRENGLFETVIEFEGYGPCSVMATMQGRATGVTEAFLCCEPLIPSRPSPAIPEVAAWLSAACSGGAAPGEAPGRPGLDQLVPPDQGGCQ
ncbi:MAG TPA: DnaJ domain-containing protein [Acidimicrobiales bacterium]